MIRATLIGPSEPPPSGELRLTAEIESDAGVQVNLSLPPGATLVEGLAEQILMPSSSTQASLEYTVRLAGPLQGPIRLRAASQDGAVERSYPAALVVQAVPPPPRTSGLTIASLFIGAASLAVGVASLLQHKKTRRHLAAIDELEAGSDEWLQSNYELWRGQERAAARARRAERKAKRKASREAKATAALAEKLEDAIGTDGSGEG